MIIGHVMTTTVQCMKNRTMLLLRTQGADSSDE